MAYAAAINVAAAAAGGGGILSLANPEGQQLVVTHVTVNLTTASAAAATADIGIAANGTTLADNLIDGLNLFAVGASDNITDKGTNGTTRRLWGATEYLTVSKASGAANAEIGAVGRLYVEYLRTGGSPGVQQFLFREAVPEDKESRRARLVAPVGEPDEPEAAGEADDEARPRRRGRQSGDA